MSFNVKIIISFLLIAVVTSSCSPTKKEEASKTTYSTLTTAGCSDTSQNTTINLSDVATCSYDSTTGYVSVQLGSTVAKTTPFLSIKIKGYSTTAGTYTCTQTTDNTTSVIGSSFNGCGVQVGMYSSASGASMNQFATFRETTSVAAMTYAGTCTVTTTETNPTIRGTINCATMPQSYLNGAPKNPIDSNVFVNLSGSFYCTFGSTTVAAKPTEAVDPTAPAKENANIEAIDKESAE